MSAVGKMTEAELLVPGGFTIWCRKALNILTILGLVDYTLPIPAAAPQMTAQQFATYRTESMKCRGYLSSFLSQQCSNMIDDQMHLSANVMWDRIVQLWGTPTDIDVMVMIQKLFSMRLSEHEDVTVHCATMSSLAAQVAAQGQIVTRLVLVSLLIASLPPSYHDIAQIIKATLSPITFEAFSIRLTTFSLEQKAGAQANTTAALAPVAPLALYAGTTAPRTCDYCHKVARGDHSAATCFEKPGNEHLREQYKAKFIRRGNNNNNNNRISNDGNSNRYNNNNNNNNRRFGNNNIRYIESNNNNSNNNNYRGNSGNNYSNSNANEDSANVVYLMPHSAYVAVVVDNSVSAHSVLSRQHTDMAHNNNSNTNIKRANNSRFDASATSTAANSCVVPVSVVSLSANLAHPLNQQQQQQSCKRLLLLDGGATQHMTHDTRALTNQYAVSMKVMVGNGGLIDVVACGTLTLSVQQQDHQMTLTINNVLLVPQIEHTLLSESRLTDGGFNINKSKKQCNIINSKSSTIAATALNIGGLWQLQAHIIYPAATTETALAVTEQPNEATEQRQRTAMRAHCQLGHLHEAAMRTMNNNGTLTSMKLSHDFKLGVCIPCVTAKLQVTPLPQQSTTATTEKLQLIHADVGIINTPSISGATSYLLIVDDYTGKLWGFLMTQKSDVFSLLKDWAASVEQQTGCRIMIIRTDGGGEFTGHESEAWLRSKGIIHQLTAPYSPGQNGKVERQNRTLKEGMNALLLSSSLNKQWWGAAFLMMVFVRNRVISSNNNTSAEQQWTGTAPDLQLLHRFGCLAYIRVPDQRRTALDVKAIAVIFVGYNEHSKSWLFHDPARNITVSSRSVYFFDDLNYISLSAQQQATDIRFQNGAAAISVYDNNVSSPVAAEVATTKEIAPAAATTAAITTVTKAAVTQLPQQRRRREYNIVPVLSGQRPFVERVDSPSRRRPPTERAQRNHQPQQQQQQLLLAADDSNSDDNNNQQHKPQSLLMLASGAHSLPQTYNDAVNCADSEKWIQSMEREWQSLQKLNVWSLVRPPPSANIINSGWVFRIKDAVDGSDPVYKSRLVAKGYSQVHGVDFTDTYASTSRTLSNRIFFHVAATLDLEIEQMDVTTAFLNATVTEDLYMKQAPGYAIIGSEHLVCKLQRALYGLKQSAMLWYDTMDKFLTEHCGLVRLQYDHSVYVSSDPSVTLIVIVHVDDMLFASNYMKHIRHVQQLLSKQFEMKNLGACKQFLGVEIIRDRHKRTITLGQQKYLIETLEQFGMSSATAVSTPMQYNSKLTANTAVLPLTVERAAEITRYQSVMGKLSYAAIFTRPDLALALSKLSQYSSNPSAEHWVAAKRVLCYIRKTVDYKLTLGGVEPIVLSAYCDSDWGGSEQRRSTTGYVISIGGKMVSWSSKQQKTVAGSTTEAELMAASMAANEVMLCRRLLSEFGYDQMKSPTIINCDNTSCIALSVSTSQSPRTKHIDIKWFAVRQLHEEKQIVLKQCSTEDMVADVLTKALDVTKHNRFVQMMGVGRTAAQHGGMLE